MLVSFGPRSDQYRAYVETGGERRPEGTTGPVTDVKTFYDHTRDRYFPATFSLISLLAPLAAFALAIWCIDRLLSLGNILLTATPIPASETMPKLPFDTFCSSEPRHHDSLLNDVFASTFHFAVTHVALLAICMVAFVAAAASIRNVLQTHGFLSSRDGAQVFGWFLALAVPASAGCFAFRLTSIGVGDRIQGLFERLFPVPQNDALKICDLTALRPLKEHLYLQMGWGALGVSVSVASLILAAAVLAWRFETYDINGAWSDSYVLRHKLNSLLTLFFVGSVLLVVTNIALASAMNWTGNVLDIVSAATPSAATPSDSGGNQPASSRGSRAGAGKGDQTANPTAKSDPIAAEFSSLKTLKTSIVSFAGALGSLILILIFTPALYGITSEIEIAGKTHASYNMAGASAAPPPAAAPTAPIIVLAKESIADDRRSYELEIIADAGAAKGKPGLESKTQPVKVPDVAGWKTVQNWKEKHGLKLSFSDFTGGFIAALAPLLSGSVVDLTKMTMGAIS